MSTGKKILGIAGIAGLAAGAYAFYKKGKKITDEQEAEELAKCQSEEMDPELEQLFEEADEAMAEEESNRTELQDILVDAMDTATDIGKKIAVGFVATVDEVKDVARSAAGNLRDIDPDEFEEDEEADDEEIEEADAEG